MSFSTVLCTKTSQDKQASVHARDMDGNTALSLLCRKQSCIEHQRNRGETAALSGLAKCFSFFVVAFDSLQTLLFWRGKKDTCQRYIVH